jgi:coniferyl-aldehyde dehydrogenase
MAGSCQKVRKSPASGDEERGNTMDQLLKSSGHNVLDQAFHRMIELSRTAPPPTLAQRLDRLARLRVAISDNEARFDQAISADFGHRCATETAIAETLLVLGEIKHAAKHLKAWMAPQRVSTAL